MNKTTESKKLALFGALAFTTLLLATPLMSVRAAGLSYTNPGETAYLTATNYDPAASFNITALQETFLLNLNLTTPGVNVTGIISTGNYFFNDTLGINGSNWFVIGALNYSGTYAGPANYNITENANVTALLSAMHSQYAIIGTGDSDVFNLIGGISGDTFSITGPGTSDAAHIQQGSGNSTYNINLGRNGTITIQASNATFFGIGSTFNIYNLIF